MRTLVKARQAFWIFSAAIDSLLFYGTFFFLYKNPLQAHYIYMAAMWYIANLWYLNNLLVSAILYVAWINAAQKFFQHLSSLWCNTLKGEVKNLERSF